MYGKHQFRWAENVSLIDRAKVSYAERRGMGFSEVRYATPSV